MKEVLERLAAIEEKLDLLLSALAEDVEQVPGDEHGLERDQTQVL
jgi:hypothetical protein